MLSLQVLSQNQMQTNNLKLYEKALKFCRKEDTAKTCSVLKKPTIQLCWSLINMDNLNSCKNYFRLIETGFIEASVYTLR